MAFFIVLIGIWPQTAQAQSACTITQFTRTASNVINFDASINSDGTRIAFVSNADGNPEIFLADTTTNPITSRSIARTLGNIRTDLIHPSINSDGTRIAFVADANGDYQIFLANTTTRPTTLTQFTRTVGEFAVRSPSINADGTRIAFEGFGDNRPQIFLATQPRAITRITPTPSNPPDFLRNHNPSINSDGTRIAFVSNADGNDEIFLADTTTNSPTITQITHTSESFTSGRPSISSNGRRIAFASNGDITGTGDNRDFNQEIFLADTTTSPPTLTQVTHTSGFVLDKGAFNGSPSINSDGTVIAFESNSDQTGNNPDGSYEIFVARCGVTPLVFIPGIAGSRLDEVGGGNIWPGNLFTVTELRKLTLDPRKAQEARDIFVSDIIRKDDVEIPVGIVAVSKETEIYKPLIDMLTDQSRGGYREYQVQGNPERRTTEGCDLSQMPFNPTLFVFPYDWRKSNAESATALKDYIGCILRLYPNSKFSVLTHSMGGLVARRYILDNPGTHNVNKLVTIAAPWLGAPKAYYILQTGEFIEEVHRLPVGQSDILEQYAALAQFFPSVRELLPSLYMFLNLTSSPFREQGWDINNNGENFESYEYHEFEIIPNGPGRDGTDFHNQAGQDDWRGDNSGVKYFHIIGIKSRADTMGSIMHAGSPHVHQRLRLDPRVLFVQTAPFSIMR